MSQEVTDLNAAVASLTTAVNGAVAELQSLAATIAANNANNPDAAPVEAAVTSLNTLATNLQAAVTASKPATP